MPIHPKPVLLAQLQESSIAPAPGFPCLGCLADEFEAMAVFLYDSEHQLFDVLWYEGDNNIGCP